MAGFAPNPFNTRYNLHFLRPDRICFAQEEIEPMSAEENKAIVRRYYEEVGNQRQLHVADEIIGSDFKLFPNASPPYGPEGVKQFITWLCITTFPDLRITIDDLVAEGDRVAARVVLHATQQTTIDWLGNFGEVPPTGKTFDLTEFVFWRLAEGRIVERWLLVDTWGMLQQLGAIPT
jgi:predicted ester cyclase